MSTFFELSSHIALILFFVAYIINLRTCFKTMEAIEDFKIELHLMMCSIEKERITNERRFETLPVLRCRS